MELKPCPFCGGTPELMEAKVAAFACVYCPNCGVRTHMADDANWAALKWNTRNQRGALAEKGATE